MTDYPYVLKTSSLKDLLQKIPTIGTPDKFTHRRLAELGYKTKNDRQIISVLRFINFIDSDSKPSNNYLSYRDKSKSRAVMAASLRDAYSDLFQTYSDAQNKDKEALRNFFSTSVTAGERVLLAVVDTFKALCELADFEAPVPEKKPLPAGPAKREQLPGGTRSNSES